MDGSGVLIKRYALPPSPLPDRWAGIYHRCRASCDGGIRLGRFRKTRFKRHHLGHIWVSCCQLSRRTHCREVLAKTGVSSGFCSQRNRNETLSTKNLFEANTSGWSRSSRLPSASDAQLPGSGLSATGPGGAIIRRMMNGRFQVPAQEPRTAAIQAGAAGPFSHVPARQLNKQKGTPLIRLPGRDLSVV